MLEMKIPKPKPVRFGGQKKRLPAGMILTILALVAITSGCASVGIRTLGHQPITVIIGTPAPSPTPCATPGGSK